MSLHQTIKKEIPEALKAHDEVKLTVVRGLASAFTNELVAKGKKPTEELTDADAIVVVKRAVKQHKDSIEQFTKGGRLELVKDEEAELKVLETYLPTMMTREQIKPIALKVKEKLGVTDKNKIGQLTGSVMKEIKGNADGGDVKAVIEELFA